MSEDDLLTLPIRLRVSNMVISSSAIFNFKIVCYDRETPSAEKVKCGGDKKISECLHGSNDSSSFVFDYRPIPLNFIKFVREKAIFLFFCLINNVNRYQRAVSF